MNSIAPSRIVVDLDAYAHNLSVVRSMIPKESAIMAVVKANAYGHGSVAVAQRALKEGAAMLAVATVEEAIVLRQAGIQEPIVVLMQPGEDAIAAAVEHGLRLVLSDVEVAERVGELAHRMNKVIPVHCKIDTGMGREGFDTDAAIGALRHLTRVSRIDIEGVCTHFPIADNARDPFTANQIRQFKQLLRAMDKEGIPYEVAHAANSAAIVNFPTSAFNMVRPGIMSYGVWPTDTPPDSSPLRPTLRWETHVVLVKEIPSGKSIGYARTFTARRPTRTAVLPVGYADGYRFSFGNDADVLIRGKRCPVRGRVSMDQIVIDVTDLPGVAIGDAAVLIGSDGSETITVAELAARAETVPNDILTGIGSRVHRSYVD